MKAYWLVSRKSDRTGQGMEVRWESLVGGSWSGILGDFSLFNTTVPKLAE